MAVALEIWNKTEIARLSCFWIEVDFFKDWIWKVVQLFWAILMFIEKLKLNYLYRETKLNDSKMSKSFLAILEKKKKKTKKFKIGLLSSTCKARSELDSRLSELRKSFAKSSRVFLIARFWNIFVFQEMRFLLIILINLAQASLRQRDSCK